MCKTIIPATDWFFLDQGNQKPVVWPVAAWALQEEGHTIGLIAAFADDQVEMGQVPHLVPVPKVPGRYVHRDQLTKEERDLHAARSNLPLQRKAPTPIDNK